MKKIIESAEIQQEKHKEEILNNQKENPKDYSL